MRKISDRIVGGVFATAAMAALIGGGVWLASAAPATTEAPAVSAEPFDVASVPDVNGLAAEQEAAAAEVEAQRVAAEAAAAESARVAAEQAAAAEAQRIADEQAAESESFEADEPSDPAPEPEPEFSGPAPGTAVHTICQVLEDGTQIPCQL